MADILSPASQLLVELMVALYLLTVSRCWMLYMLVAENSDRPHEAGYDAFISGAGEKKIIRWK